MPNFGSAFFNRGVARRKSKDYLKAIQDFTKAIEINPKHSLSYDNRALCRMKLNDKEGACKDMKMAASLGLKKRIDWLNSSKGAWCKNMN